MAVMLAALSSCGGGSNSDAPPRIVVAVSPASSTVQAGLGSQAFTATVSNASNTAVNWSVNGVAGGNDNTGTVSSNGLYTAPSNLPPSATVTVAATSLADAAQSGSAQVTISAPVAVTVSPASLALQAGAGSQALSVTVANSANTTVRWQVNGIDGGNATVGLVSGAGVYVAPATVPSPSTVTVSAVSVADASRSGSVQITITAPAVAVSVSPTLVSLQAGLGRQQFSASVSNATNAGVIWAVNNIAGGTASVGTISSAGAYTAPTNPPAPATVTVTATSIADPSRSASAQVTVTPAVATSVEPATVSLQAGIGAQTFAATVRNSANAAVTWRAGGIVGGNAIVGTISSGGAYLAPRNVPSPAIVTVTATPAADPTRSGSALVTVGPPVAVTVSPLVVTLNADTGTQAFTATVANHANTTVTWYVDGIVGGNATVGTVSPAGVYRAPAVVPPTPAVTITAASVVDPSRFDVAQVNLTAPPGAVAVSVRPLRAGTTTSQPQKFTATVSNSAVTAVDWKVDGIPGGSVSVGSIDANGLYLPPASPGVHTISATSAAAATATGNASVAVTNLAAVATQRYDNARSGQNPAEYALTPAVLATPGSFGKLFQCGVDAAVYAQPLYVANLPIGGGAHNVVLVATENDSVYAFDADRDDCKLYWQASFLSQDVVAVPSEDASAVGDLPGTFGITGTPVIDLATRTLYVAANTKEGDEYFFKLHALDLRDGTERSGSPATLEAAVDSGPFEPLRQLQRPGLLLANDMIYVAFGSHQDIDPYYGWLFAFDKTTLEQKAAFNTAPLGTRSSIWMSGAGPAADAAGNVYASTGNGSFDAVNDFGNSVLKLRSTASGVSLVDFYGTNNQEILNDKDWDFGSGGVLLLPDSAGSPAHPHLALTGGKEGVLFLLDRDNMGGYNPDGNDNVVQALRLSLDGGCVLCGVFTTPTLWRDNLYIGAVRDTVRQYKISGARIEAAPESRSDDVYRFPGTNVVVSANGSSNGIAWALDTNANGTENGTVQGPAILNAYDADDLAVRLWSSRDDAADTCGDAVKFVVPIVANGKVYVAGNGSLTVYGLRP